MSYHSGNRHVDALRSALVNDVPPYCAGTCSFPVRDFDLFFSKNCQQNAYYMNLANPSQSDLKLLTEACAPATFGRNSEDILDESYRRAGKLNTVEFAAKLEIETSKVMDAIRYGLLVGDRSTVGMIVEMYKLNVYDKDCFFKAHKDTPRAKSMFASLVVVFPTPHEGGELAFRHKGKEWIFDASKTLAEANSVSDSSKANVAYVAFFSDVEHEVFKVTSGHRITITYNLYYDSSKRNTEDIMRTSRLSYVEEAFKARLEEILRDESFLPDGGYLGFGLIHKYPTLPYGKEAGIFNCLKGNDALVQRVFADVGLKPRPRLLYREGDRIQILLPHDVRLDGIGIESESLSEALLDDYTGTMIQNIDYENRKTSKGRPRYDIHWVTNVTDFNDVEEVYATYGNEAIASYLYASFCLTVQIGKPGTRTEYEEIDE